MNHAIHRVTGVRIVGEYTLEVEFADGTRQNIDFQPVMAGEIYGPLLDRSLFDKVKVDREIHTTCMAQRSRLRSGYTPRLANLRSSFP